MANHGDNPMGPGQSQGQTQSLKRPIEDTLDATSRESKVNNTGTGANLDGIPEPASKRIRVEDGSAKPEPVADSTVNSATDSSPPLGLNTRTKVKGMALIKPE